MKADEQVVGALAHFTGGRAYPNILPQGPVLPAIMYQTSREPVSTLMGKTVASKALVTINIVAEDATTAREWASKVRETMQRQDFSTACPEPEAGDLFDPDTGLHQYTLAYTLWEFDN